MNYIESVRWHVRFLMVKFAVRLLRATGWYDGYWAHWRGPSFDYAQSKGIHVLPVHFYSPVPDIRKRSPDSNGENRPEFELTALRIGHSLSFLSELMREHGPKTDHLVHGGGKDKHDFTLSNSAYGSGDAEILYAMIRRSKPRRIVEVGCGNSTLLISATIAGLKEQDSTYECDYTCIDPHPPPYLQPPPPDVSHFVAEPVQTVGMDTFLALGEGDVLFIDSSHVAKYGSDVVAIYLKILPQLKPGIIVHVHDIFLPDDYPREFGFDRRFFWNEQYVVHALIQGNGSLKVLLPVYALWRLHRDAFDSAVGGPSNGRRPTALWMSTCNTSEGK